MCGVAGLVRFAEAESAAAVASRVTAVESDAGSLLATARSGFRIGQVQHRMELSRDSTSTRT